MLDHLKMLDMNEFMHDISPHVINLQLVQAHAPIVVVVVTQPITKLNEFGEFDHSPQNRDKVIPPNDAPDWWSSFQHGPLGFNQFSILDGLMSKSAKL